MSWLRRLRSHFDSSPYRCADRRVCLDESPDCEANFDGMAPDAVILQFEKMVDARDLSAGGALRTKCDLIAVQGNESSVEIVLVELKAGQSQGQRAIRSQFSRARHQLEKSVAIIQEEFENCRIQLPRRRIGHAVVLLAGARQETVARDVLSNVNVRFRRETGFRLSIARCGDDIGKLIGDTTV